MKKRPYPRAGSGGSAGYSGAYLHRQRRHRAWPVPCADRNRPGRAARTPRTSRASWPACSTTSGLRADAARPLPRTPASSRPRCGAGPRGARRRAMGARDCRDQPPASAAIASPTPASEHRCPACGSPRLIRHAEIDTLTIAHIDCDAFYATIEKRDDPSLADKPVIVGGGKRGVVAACCYVARTYGIRSAMPMFEALRRCPHAVVIKPQMSKYVEVGRAVRARDARPDAAGRAALDRRGVPRPLRHAAPARPERRQAAGALRAPGRARPRHHRFGRACPPTSSSPRSPPTSTSRAALPCSAPPRRRRSWRRSRSASSTASAR